MNPPFMAPGLSASDESQRGSDAAEVTGRRASPSLPALGLGMHDLGRVRRERLAALFVFVGYEPKHVMQL